MSHFGYDKKAYTHGFEDIYALEKIDVKSIRKVVPTTHVQQQKISAHQRIEAENIESPQMHFSFFEHEEKVKNFKLQEPLVVLQLTLQAEKRLLELGVKTLNDIYLIKQNGFNHIKNLGQGHIDEIEEKFFNYVGHYKEKKSFIDFASLLKCTLGDLDSKSVHLLLNPYKLSHLFPITPGERINVRHLQGAKKEEVISKILLEAKKVNKANFIKEAFEEIFEVFVKNWMEKRMSIATHEEIYERLLKKSQDPEVAFNALRFFMEIYFNNSFPLTKNLHILEGNLFALSKDIIRDYKIIVETAKSYFYNPHVTYQLEDFLILLNKEFALNWLSINSELVLKVLKTSQKFRVKKNNEGKIIVGLNFLDDLIVKNS
jgi:hypothetical protein